MRILILEDDEVDRRALRRALSHSGLEVDVVEAERLGAVERLLEEPGDIDAIVADYLLPDGDAADLLRALRANGGDPPVIVLTGRGDERIAAALMKLGAADYLLKSELTPRRMRKALRAAVRVASAERRARAAQEAEHRLVGELAGERERLEKALIERDEVLAIVSHDLRSPLSNVSLALETLSAEDVGPTDRERIAAIAMRAVRRMQELIGDLLDITRIDKGALTLEIAEHDAAQIAAEVIDDVRIAAERGGVAVELDAPPALGTLVADRSRVAQVLQNLLSNALRFTPRGGHVRVRASIEGDAIRYAVEDDGPGVAPEVRVHLFERFWQARRADRSGAGLGLSIVKGIVEAHGGRVGLVDTGRGACFEVLLPRTAVRAVPRGG